MAQYNIPTSVKDRIQEWEKNQKICQITHQKIQNLTMCSNEGPYFFHGNSLG